MNEACKHLRACQNGFDLEAAKHLLADWTPDDSEDPEVAFILGNPAHAEIRRRWPRGEVCPDCGMKGIFYASPEHYAMGDW